MAQILVDVILDRLPNIAITAMKVSNGELYPKFNIMSTYRKRII